MALNLKDIVKVGDYLKVEQKVVCYEAGEVAHIENVMTGETRERKNTYLEREERTTETETINETEQERDTQTSERYSMQREAQKVVNQDQHFDVSLSVSGQVGPMTIAANTGFSMGQSTQQTDKTASNYAKNVVEIARNRTFQRTRSYEKLTIIKQWEDINTHKFENIPSTLSPDVSNKVGIYRWVDKKYENRLLNYGKRLILTLMIPDPAAWHRFAAALPTAGSNTLEKPEKPNFVAKDLNETNFAEKASLYGVSGIKCPAKEIYKATSYAYNAEDTKDEGDGVGGHSYPKAIPRIGTGSTENKNLIIEEGYEATEAHIDVTLDTSHYGTSTSGVFIHVGDAKFGANGAGAWTGDTLPLNKKLSGTVPVSVMGYIAGAYTINVSVKCTLTDAAFAAWQLETYTKIMEAYERKKSEYDNQLNALKARSTDYGNNPLTNRKVEQQELKKSFIAMLNEDTDYFMRFNETYLDETKNAPYSMGYPGIDMANVFYGYDSPTKKVSFFEESIDWGLMSYKFYPYYWQGQDYSLYNFTQQPRKLEEGRWSKVYSIRDNDDVFEKFLQAGYAQVTVPVKLGSELEVLNFLEHGVMVNADFYANTPEVSKAKAEIQDLNKPTEEAPTEVSKWYTKAPTNLVILQTSAQGAPGVGLPCWESEDKRLNPDKFTLDEQFGSLNP